MLDHLRQRYHEQGFAILRQFLNAADIGHLVEELETLTKTYPRLPAALKKNIILVKDLSEKQRGGLEVTGDAPYLIGELPVFSHIFTEMLCQKRLWDAARAVLSCDTLHYHFSNATMKPKRVGPGISWHRDYPNRYICGANSAFTRAMVCLDGMSRENGCTQVVENSHHVSDETAADKQVGRSPLVGNLLDIECDAGDVVFLHPKTIHGGSRTAPVKIVETSSFNLAAPTTNW